MPIAGNMSHMIPSHVLRVGQSIGLGRAPEPVEPSVDLSDPELDISLENLNQLILELDPTFEPIQVRKSPQSTSCYTDESSPDVETSHCVLVPRACPGSVPSMVPSPSSSIPIPRPGGPCCSPQGSLVFSGSPSSSRPPLPGGSVPRRNRAFSRAEMSASQASLRMSTSNRNSGVSLLSMSPGSDTSYILGSCLSLASEDADGPESLLTQASGSFGPGSRTQEPGQGPVQGPFHTRPSPTKPSPLDHFQGLHSKGIHSSPASLAGSLTDIPVVLVNGAPERALDRRVPQNEAHEVHRVPSKPFSPLGFQAHGSQPSMKFVMDTSKLWFRPHINRAEAEALVKDREAGSFVVRDSTSFRGSFGLVMKVQPPNCIPPSGHPGGRDSDTIRHFLIESSAKGVRIKGSSQEPYFGSLSALVYQHTIHIYALPCKLLLQSHDPGAGEEAAEVKTTTSCNFLYLNAVPTETLTGPRAVQRAVSRTLGRDAAVAPTVVNLKVCSKGVTLTDVKRKLFFRRHYPAHLLSYGGLDADERLWLKDTTLEARMFGFVCKGVEAGVENVCHVFAEYDPLQLCDEALRLIRGVTAMP